MQAFVDSLGAQTVVWFTDNQNVARILSIGSKVPALQQIALDIHRLCLISAISVDMQWTPRDLNVLADDISKLVDRDDYTINDSVFFAMDTRAIDLPVITTRSSLYSTPGTISLGHLVSTPLLRIGPATTTGSALLSV